MSDAPNMAATLVADDWCCALAAAVAAVAAAGATPPPDDDDCGLAERNWEAKRSLDERLGETALAGLVAAAAAAAAAAAKSLPSALFSIELSVMIECTRHLK